MTASDEWRGTWGGEHTNTHTHSRIYKSNVLQTLSFRNDVVIDRSFINGFFKTFFNMVRFMRRVSIMIGLSDFLTPTTYKYIYTQTMKFLRPSKNGWELL